MSDPASPVYLQCGLRMRSEVPVALPLAVGGDYDIDVRWGANADTSGLAPGEPIASYGEGDLTWYTLTKTESGYLIRFRDCGEFHLSEDLSDVEVRRDPNGRHHLLPILLAGTVGAILLTLRGNTVLHASAVTHGDTGAVAFVGQSGRGKSTVAALMCIGGAALITDDVLMVEAGPPARCVGGAPELRLREKAASIAQTSQGQSRATADDRIAFAPRTGPTDWLNLEAIVIPSPSRETFEVTVERKSQSDALFAILAFPRVHQWRSQDVLARDFTVLSSLVNQVPVFEAVIPWGPPFSPDIAPALAELLVT